MEPLTEAAEHDASANAILTLNGIEYAIDTFRVDFAQSHDYKGKPQREAKGGILHMTFYRTADEQLNYWMFHNKVSYSGTITFSPFSRTETPHVIIKFIQGRCARYSKFAEGVIGLSIVVTAKKIFINDIDHQNDVNYYEEKTS
jgi:hypothetical protein